MEDQTGMQPAAPQAAPAVPVVKQVKELLSQDKIKEKFGEVLGQKAPQFMASITNTVSGSAQLKKCPANSIIGAAFVAATYDLPIDSNLGFAAIVPYNESVWNPRKKDWEKVPKAQFQMMYKGFIQLATVIARAMIAGVESNVNANTITMMSVPVEGIISITNPVKATGGTEEETDDELRERIMEANEQMDDSYIGNESDYKRWAESVAGIGTAIVVPEWNGPETVKIIVLDGNGEAANETLQKAVYNYIMSPESPLDRLAPPNTILTVSAPELVEIDYTIKSIELEDGYAQEEVLKDFKTGLAKYYKTVNSEGEVKYNWVHSVLTNTPGVDDFEELLMNGGISNIKIKLDQYPNTKSVMVKEGS